MKHRLFARILLIAFTTAAPASYCVHAQTRTPVAYMGTSGTTYNLNDVVLLNGVDYISLSANNLGNPPASSPARWIALDGDGDVSVKTFGAVGDGATDDTTALQSALTWMAANERCLSGLVTGHPDAPSGACTVVGWMFSQDGHATFCNGTSWIPKI